MQYRSRTKQPPVQESVKKTQRAGKKSNNQNSSERIRVMQADEFFLSQATQPDLIAQSALGIRVADIILELLPPLLIHLPVRIPG